MLRAFKVLPLIPRRELSLAEHLIGFSGRRQWEAHVVGARVDEEGGGGCVEVFLVGLSSILEIAD